MVMKIIGILLYCFAGVFLFYCIKGLYRHFEYLPSGNDKNMVAVGITAEVVLFVLCVIQIIKA